MSRAGQPQAGLCHFHCALSNRKVVHWEAANKCCRCFPWRYQATWTLNWILQSTENDFGFLFPLWNLIETLWDPCICYFMRTETWDENGPYRIHKAFLHIWMERGRGVWSPTEGPCIQQSAWRNKEHWPASDRAASVPSLPAGASHWPPARFLCEIKMPSPPCLLPGSSWGINERMMRKCSINRSSLYRWKLLPNRVSKFSSL